MKPRRVDRRSYFLSCDWGTSRLRVRLVRGDDRKVLAWSDSTEGIAGIAATLGRRTRPAGRVRAFFAVLCPHLERVAGAAGVDYHALPLVISGMASSTLGVRELPYAPVPFSLQGERLVVERLGSVSAWPVNILLVSGVSTGTDIMRGEETQAVGWAIECGRPPARAVLVLPGTHSKHLEIDRGHAVGFATYMTGEFFALLSTHGVLAQTLTPARGKGVVAGSSRFAEGVRIGARESLLHACFLVRARAVLSRASASDSRRFLSGLLLGAELAALARSKAARVDIVADAPLDRLYADALRILGFGGAIRRSSAQAAVIAGHGQLARLHRLLPG